MRIHRYVAVLVGATLVAGCTTGDRADQSASGTSAPAEDAETPDAGVTADAASVGWTCDDASELDLADLATQAQDDEMRTLAERCIVDATATDADDRALGRAAQFGRVDAVRYLLDLGADVKWTGPADLPVLVWAARPRQSEDRPDPELDAGKAATVPMLVEAGADVEAEDESGSTALVVASRFGFTMTVAALLDAGADTDAVDDLGNTPLLAAAANQVAPVELVELLLKRGADPTATNPDGQTAAQIAREAGRPEIAERLEQARG